ncbi:MAG: hypothetical protein WBA22_08710 [Candidatus Methanofastidiosia archaeon]
MACKKCGSILVMGKNNTDEMWCPSCENFEILSFEESLKFCYEIADSYRERYDALLQVAHKDNLLLPLLCLREKNARKVMDTMAFSVRDLVVYSLILHDVLAGKCGATVNLGKSIELVGDIVLSFKNHLEALKQFQFIKDGYAVIVRIPRDLEQLHINTGTKTRKNAFLMFRETDSSILAFWFNEKWPKIEKNFSKLSIYSESEVRKTEVSHRGKRKILELREKRVRKKSKNNRGEFRSSIFAAWGSALQVNLADPGNHMLDFCDIERSPEVVDVLHHLAYYAEKQLPRKTSQDPLSIEDLVVTRSYEEVRKCLRPLKYNVGFALEQLVSSKNNTKMVPLIIEDQSGLRLCPVTLRLFRLYFSEFLKKDELQELRSQQGLPFEIEVCRKLERFGVDVSDPIKKGEKMMNITDKKTPTFEIDILGSFNSHLLVIECKSKWLNPLWYTQRYQEYRRRDLIKEAEEKMPKRMEWVRNSLRPGRNSHFFRKDPSTGKRRLEKRDSLGYSLQSASIHGVIVTLFEEPIDMHKDITILPIERLDEIRNVCC